MVAYGLNGERCTVLDAIVTRTAGHVRNAVGILLTERPMLCIGAIRAIRQLSALQTGIRLLAPLVATKPDTFVLISGLYFLKNGPSLR